MVAILFVCLGNVCRSPAAESIFRHLAETSGFADITVSSCGLGDWYTGEFSDQRMVDAAKIRGYHCLKRAEQFRPEYLDKYDYILACDHEVVQQLYYYAKTPQQKAKIALITAFSPSYKDKEVPDPYYAGAGAFDHVINMLEDSCEGLLEHIRKQQRSQT